MGVARLEKQAASGYVTAISLAFVHAGLGQLDEAFALLDRAWEVREPWLIQALTVNATLNPLRSDPRFQDLRHRINLPAV